ncbi:MAG: hypothetical protein RIK87_27730 [Fuerstiella sp.]
MIVPEFWAESRIQRRFPDRQVTVRRFGWSDISQEDAQRHADERVREAFDRILSGADLPRRERRVRYNGADGLPIREEIVERFGDAVVTRNSYGARCLNSPDVFFADVDFFEPLSESCGAWLMSLLVGLAAAVYVGLQLNSILLGLLALAVGFVAFLLLLTGLSRAYVRISGGVEQVTLRRVDAFADSHRDWHLRIYRTPNGFRILALHATFDPRSEEVEKAFRSLGVDRTYALMCQKQNCFRARLTAKPWRIGIDERLKPQPGVWPINPSYLPHRNRWVDEYESTAAGYSACHFLKATGAVHVVSRQAEAVCEFHDRICRAHDNLTLA